MTCRVLLPCKICEKRAAEIGEILSVGELTVDLDVVDDRVAGVLVDDALGALLELLAVGVGPPVAQVARGVELAAFVVEGMGELVTHGGARVAVVWSRIRERAE